MENEGRPTCTHEQAEIADEDPNWLEKPAVTEAVALAKAFGYRLSRTKGSHHIFVHPRTKELINLQEVGGRAKPYQVRQLLDIVERYNLTLETGDES